MPTKIKSTQKGMGLGFSVLRDGLAALLREVE